MPPPGGKLYGMSNSADLVYGRGSGVFNTNFQDPKIQEQLNTTFVCEDHVNELLTSWKPTHIPRTTIGGAKVEMCSFPELTQQGTKHNARAGNMVALKKDAQLMMEAKGILLPPGASECSGLKSG